MQEHSLRFQASREKECSEAPHRRRLRQPRVRPYRSARTTIATLSGPVNPMRGRRGKNWEYQIFLKCAWCSKPLYLYWGQLQRLLPRLRRLDINRDAGRIGGECALPEGLDARMRFLYAGETVDDGLKCRRVATGERLREGDCIDFPNKLSLPHERKGERTGAKCGR